MAALSPPASKESQASFHVEPAGITSVGQAVGTSQTVHEAIDQRLTESNIKLNQLGQIVQRCKEKWDLIYYEHQQHLAWVLNRLGY